MAMQIIRLPGGEWEYDEEAPLGKAGGFGEVFRGRGLDGEVAIKRLKLNATQAAHRELTIGQQLMQRSLSYVVPIIDAGQDAESDRYFFVMPLCDCSLQDKIDEATNGVDLEVASEAISSIIAGLSEVKDITHRDLKPANILLHEGRWKVADFGIAKFVEDSTSTETLRDSLTPAYAAPEQWRGERPSTATDVYALGCIIHAIFLGHPPFVGSIDDIREDHLHTAPAPISVLPPRISAFVSYMLRKPSNARPTLARCEKVLAGIREAQNQEVTAHPAIEVAAKQVAEREAIEEAKRIAAQTLRRERDELFADASKEILAIKDRLFENIRSYSESVKIDSRGPLIFGSAKLHFGNPEQLDEVVAAIHAAPDRELYHYTGWDVLGWALIDVNCEKGSGHRPYTWSASLLFADRKDGGGFRWYEVSFWTIGRDRDEPFGLEGYKADIDLALGNIMHSVNVAYGPLPIDGEDEEVFIARWIDLVAKAAIGQLTRPSGMPIRDFG
jgi:serine/threonine protein kinase